MDPVTNIIRPRGVRLRQDIRGFKLGPWPAHTIQPFIHELTHHWCFHSPVGAALALLRFRTIRRLTAGGTVARDDDRLFDEMLTVDTVLDLFRPLAEGLALFAEYDMSPGSSGTVTTPLTWASVALSPYADLPDLSNPEQARAFRIRLNNLRLTSDSIERKLAFLSQPVTTLEQAYFDGYLLVKRLYADLTTAVPAFADSDLFLSYLRAFFFDDYGTVAILADARTDVFQRQRDLIEYFSGRFATLYDPGLAGDVHSFEAAHDRPARLTGHVEANGLRMRADRLQAGRDALDSLVSELDDDPVLPARERQVRDLQRVWLSRRSLAYVAVEPAIVKVRNGMMSVWPDPIDHEFPLMAGPALVTGERPEGSTDRGWMSLVLSPSTGHFATVIGIGSQVVTVQWPVNLPPMPEMDALIRDPACSPFVAQKEHEELSAWVEGYFAQAPEPLRTAITQVRAATRHALDTIANVFFGRWGDDGPVAIGALRSKKRLWDVFDGDRQMFETFVAFGILRGEDVLLPSLGRQLAERGWNAGPALVRALQIATDKGLSLVVNDEGVFRWLL